METIESRFRTVEWCKENMPKAIRLYHQNVDVDQYNKEAVPSAMECVTHDLIVGYRNSAELTNARTKLHKMSVVKTSGLPYMLNLATGHPYMITTNIDVEDGLVNGAIGEVMHIEILDCDPQQPAAGPSSSSNPSQLSSDLQVWLNFEHQNIGHKARIKSRPHVLAQLDTLQVDWTPIRMCTGTISLSNTIKCKRIQFPLIPACAITIHKSQGGTFNEIVVQYDRAQHTQLVYVALSRVTSLEGLYLTNKHNDFKFYHGLGTTSSVTKEIKEEFKRLEQHRLQTLLCSAEQFYNASDTSQFESNNTTDPYKYVVVVNTNVQISLPTTRTLPLISFSDVLSI
ncbi:ATP-dependent DNA helicase PIF1-like [Diachasma alloeum]|uniref:ATP-dependent DNA helicase PIF1-like n=1 Tax=Diachasma alloeum TaxID=454923 RepID=UPI0007382889|nr:ATP-dependent DNA helicase PIF1-like [Diachasma alloeum]